MLNVQHVLMMSKHVGGDFASITRALFPIGGMFNWERIAEICPYILSKSHCNRTRILESFEYSFLARNHGK